MKAFLVFVAAGLLPLGATAQTPSAADARAAAATGSAQAAVARQVEGILARQCISCHGPAKKKGGLDLSRRTTALAGGKSGEAIVPGEPDESLLVEKVAEGEMPPKEPLTREQAAAVRAWVAAGAPYASEPLSPPRAGADWWSFRPIAPGATPEITGPDAGWVRTRIDAFILAGLKGRGLRPSPSASRAALIRRVTFDLTGLPPAPEAVAAFVADCDPMAYEKLVDRLLASPHYGERWGRHWLDVVRFGESEGYETNMPRPSAWPYRDYVIRAFNRDVPFSRFVFEQLAGDTLGMPATSADASAVGTTSADWLTQAATGFIVGGTHDIVGNQTTEGMLQQRADDLDDMITATGTTFLGLTVQCARCHDHKFDPIAQKDYYGLQAVFAGVKHGERELAVPDAENRLRESAAISAELARIEASLDRFEPLARPGCDQPARPMVNPRRNVERFAPIKSRMIRMTILATNDRTEPCIDEIEVYAASSQDQPPAPAPNLAPTNDKGQMTKDKGDQSSPPPRNVALAGAGGKASASSEYPGSDIHKIAHLNDGRLGNGRSWISRVPGKGQLTIVWSEPATIDRIVWGRDRQEVYRDRLATEYYIESALEPGKWQIVASSRDRAGDGQRRPPQSQSQLPLVGRASVPAVPGSPPRSQSQLPKVERASVPAVAPTGSGPELAVSDPGLGVGATERDPNAIQQRADLLSHQARLRERLGELGPTVKVYAGTFSQPGPTHILARGDPSKQGALVRPSSIAVIKPAVNLDPNLPEAQRRAALARWIADPANPLPARVMVNRVWHYHFGRGIVATTSDFGFNGSPPSHPELLDWLAATYIAAGWRLKPIHRLIVTSAAYRQSSLIDPAVQGIDRDNRLLGRMNSRRLEAESIRDAILAVSGRLDPRMGGPGYNIWEKNTNYVAVYKPRLELGPDTFRRMVYQFKPRSQADPTFGAFDCPEAALVAPRRNVSTTALQALNLLNSHFVVRQAACFAERLTGEAGPDAARQAERGFQLAFGRAPSDSERTAAVALIRSHGTTAFCRALYNANEFVYVP
ncbi:MAG: PSD1 and planctomycete cytochrome C domain-containing protein [Isosphaeraceae bacterium]